MADRGAARSTAQPETLNGSTNMSSENRAAVTVIGLGAMGAALTGALLDNGHPTTVWNRTVHRADALVAKGAARAYTLTEAVTASPVVLLCVLDDRAARAVLESAREALAGRVVVNLTNGTPQQARATAEWAAGYGADYLHGGIMAVPSMIGAPGAAVLYSGSRSAFEPQRDLLGTLGAADYLGPDPGLASLQDLALLSAMYGMFGGFAHALEMVGAEKIPAARFAPRVVAWLESLLPLLPAMAQALDAGEDSDGESNLAMQAVAFDNIIRTSADQGVDTALMALLRDRQAPDGAATAA